MHNSYDVIILGGGAAGLSAALTLARARRRILVLDGGEPRNRFAARMHGVLGQEGTDPLQFVRRGREEVVSLGGEVVTGVVDEVREIPEGIEVTVAGEVVSARALVLATGASDRLPPVAGLAQRWGIDALHCPYCHGYEAADRRLGVLATTPMGGHLARLVRQWSDRLTLFVADPSAAPSPEELTALRARGVRIAGPIDRLVIEEDRLTGVESGGAVVGLDALFVTAVPEPLDAPVAALGLARRETPMGSFIETDPTGRTSHPRIWAAGNVTDPAANVPISVGAGALVGAMVNMALVDEDSRLASAAAAGEASEFWESRYQERPQIWSGRVNPVLADVAATLTPGRALDLGCGEGGDVLWLARQGWTAVGIDISEAAVSRARDAAAEAQLAPGAATFIAGDLGSRAIEGEFDLVTASFFQSPVHLPRVEILRSAAARVAPGGHLLLTAHAAPPPWSTDHVPDHFRSVDPAEEVAQLALDPKSWEVVVAEVRRRPAVSPTGEASHLDDSVVLLRRR